MVPDDFPNSKCSKMTLAVARDSGFYQIDLDNADYYSWGRGHGCGLIEKKCDAFLSSEMCENEGQIQCDSWGRVRRKCKVLVFSDGCGVWQNLVDCRQLRESGSGVNAYGPSSRCLNTKVTYL